MAAPAGGGEEPEPEQEFDICNDEGFVYKVPSGLYPDAAPSSAQAAAGPDPEIVGLRRRRRALLRLRAKRLRQLSRWEALASELLAPLPDPRLPAPQSPPASPHPVAGDATATAASASVLDDLIAQADVQAELLKKASQLCDEINTLCDARDAAIVDDIAALPVWGDPRELLASFHSPHKQPDPGTSGWDGGFKSLDSQQGKRAIGVASAAVKRLKASGDKRIQGPSECKRCFQFDRTRNTCCQTHDEQGNELPPPILTENRKSKGAVSPSSSNSVAAQASDKSKRQNASGCKSTPPGSTTRRKVASTPRAPDTSRSPGPTTRSKVASTPRAPDASRSPGPTTRRRAAAQTVPPCSS
ncbi:unnamed protein product [Urochloa decumbens]|uniref:Uncharacterized protein n=1 Tax=Urochloa decumbens TaxID=240449 RepID=A0ABC8Z2P9_9POAL